ncbi:MAG: alpha/beta hydrolase family protein [Gemmatirosa sp.]
MRRALLALALTTAAACGDAQPRAPVRDPVTLDVAARDTAHPMALVELHFPSAGARMNGLLYLAPGRGPHPTVALLHGYPGNERNLDLAQAIRRAGMNVLFFHYRGAWGSGGEFSFANAQADVAAALAFLRDPAIAARHRVDSRRLALVGHSMGGWLALRAAAADPAVACAAGLEFWDAGRDGVAMRTDTASRREFRAYTTDITAPGGPLRAAGGANALVRSLLDRGDEWSLATSAPALRGRPVLLLDNADNASHAPLVDALRRAGNGRVTTHVWPTDHSFSDRRVGLARTVIDWLRVGCRL